MLAALLALAAGCAGPAAEPSSSAGQSPSPIATTSSTVAASPASPSPVATSFPPLPEPTITDGAAIGSALRDPDTAATGVVSLFALLGVGVAATDGSVLLPAGDGGFVLGEADAHGLVAMADDDAGVIAAGRVPATLADYHLGLVQLLPDLTLEALLAAYQSAYAAAPASPMAGVTAALDWQPETPATRIELWALFVDGFVAPALARGQSPLAVVGPGVVQPGVLATAGLELPFIPSPDPRLDATEFTLLLAQLPAMAYAIRLDLQPFTASGHEGHGGPGPTIELVARHYPSYGSPLSPTRGLPLALPAPWSPAGVAATWSSGDEGVLADHGTITTPLFAPQHSDMTGAAHFSYQLKQEEGDQTGPLDGDSAMVTVSVRLADLLTANYLLPPQALGMVPGDRLLSAVVLIEWHAPPGWYVDEMFTNAVGVTGHEYGQKCLGLGGEWILGGEYESPIGQRGIQTWTVTIDGQTLQGTFTYNDDAIHEIAGVTIYTYGHSSGSAEITVGDDGSVDMVMREVEHAFYSTTSAGGEGQDQDAPLQTYHQTWLPGDPDGLC